MNKNRIVGWLFVLIFLGGAIYCEFKVGTPIPNAIMDIVLTCAVFYIGTKDTNKKTVLLQSQIQELKTRIEQLEDNSAKPQAPDAIGETKAKPSVDWAHAIKR